MKKLNGMSLIGTVISLTLVACGGGNGNPDTATATDTGVCTAGQIKGQTKLADGTVAFSCSPPTNTATATGTDTNTGSVTATNTNTGTNTQTTTTTVTQTASNTNTNVSTFDPNSPACTSQLAAITGGSVGKNGLWVVTTAGSNIVWNLAITNSSGQSSAVLGYAIKADEFDQMNPPSLTYYTQQEDMNVNCTILVPDTTTTGAPTVQGVFTENTTNGYVATITDGKVKATWTQSNQATWKYFVGYP